MAVTVRIPTPLRTMTGGAATVQVDATTVAEMIDALDRAYPGMRARLCEEDGRLRRFVNIFVGDEDIRFLEGVETRLADEIQVSIIPAVAGGDR